MKFEMDSDEIAEFKKWEAEHNKTCVFGKPAAYTGAIGGRFSFIFTPTSIGQLVVVKCACGEKECVSKNL